MQLNIYDIDKIQSSLSKHKKSHKLLNDHFFIKSEIKLISCISSVFNFIGFFLISFDFNILSSILNKLVINPKVKSSKYIR